MTRRVIWEAGWNEPKAYAWRLLWAQFELASLNYNGVINLHFCFGERLELASNLGLDPRLLRRTIYSFLRGKSKGFRSALRITVRKVLDLPRNFDWDSYAN